MSLATRRHADVTLRQCPVSVVRCVAALDSHLVRMQFTHATVLNTLVSVHRFLVVNGDTLDGFNRLGYRKLLNEVVVNLSGLTVNQTSVKHADTADAADGCAVRNVRRLHNMLRFAAVAAGRLRNLPEFVSTKMLPVNSPAGHVDRLVCGDGADDGALHADVRRSGVAGGLSVAPQSGADTVAAAIINLDSTRAVQRRATVTLTDKPSRCPATVKVLDAPAEPLIVATSHCSRG